MTEKESHLSETAITGSDADACLEQTIQPDSAETAGDIPTDAPNDQSEDVRDDVEQAPTDDDSAPSQGSLDPDVAGDDGQDATAGDDALADESAALPDQAGQSEQEDALGADDEFEEASAESGDEETLDMSDETTDQQSIDPGFEPTVESVVEAVLFASDEPLTPARLANIVEIETRQIRIHIDNLNAKYQAANSSFRVEQIAGGYQMLTLSPYNHWLKKLLRVRSDSKLSPAALETLAIIAYKQPVIRADVEAIRGVASGEVIRSLMYKGLVKIIGRAEVLGRPMLYGTTKKFLEVFGLNSLKDLPKVEELKKPSA